MHMRRKVVRQTLMLLQCMHIRIMRWFVTLSVFSVIWKTTARPVKWPGGYTSILRNAQLLVHYLEKCTRNQCLRASYKIALFRSSTLVVDGCTLELHLQRALISSNLGNEEWLSVAPTSMDSTIAASYGWTDAGLEDFSYAYSCTGSLRMYSSSVPVSIRLFFTSFHLLMSLPAEYYSNTIVVILCLCICIQGPWQIWSCRCSL